MFPIFLSMVKNGICTIVARVGEELYLPRGIIYQLSVESFSHADLELSS